MNDPLPIPEPLAPTSTPTDPIAAVNARIDALDAACVAEFKTIASRLIETPAADLINAVADIRADIDRIKQRLSAGGH